VRHVRSHRRMTLVGDTVGRVVVRSSVDERSLDPVTAFALAQALLKAVADIEGLATPTEPHTQTEGPEHPW
jgi:hypothetical protein